MPQFKLLRGRYVGNDADGVTQYYHARDPKRNIVESDIDLESRFGSEKFQSLHRFLGQDSEASLRRQIDELKKQLAAAEARNTLRPGEKREEPLEVQEETGDEEQDDLRSMTVAQLRKIAEEEGVELGTAARKDDIIAAIEFHRESGEEE